MHAVSTIHAEIYSPLQSTKTSEEEAEKGMVRAQQAGRGNNLKMGQNIGVDDVVLPSLLTNRRIYLLILS